MLPSGPRMKILSMLSERLAEFPSTPPVVYWRGRDLRRCVLDVPWAATKAVLDRVLVSYRSRHSLQALISGDLAERGGCSHFRTAAGHQLGLVRPTMLIDSFASDRPVLLGREDSGALRDAVIVADIDHAREVLRDWTDEGLTDPRAWAAYEGERGESRSRLFFLEALSHPGRSSARTELEVSVRIEIAASNRSVYGAG